MERQLKILISIYSLFTRVKGLFKLTFFAIIIELSLLIIVYPTNKSVNLLKKAINFVFGKRLNINLNTRRKTTTTALQILNLYEIIVSGMKDAEFIRADDNEITIHQGQGYTLDLALFQYSRDISKENIQGDRICQLERGHELYYNKYPWFKVEVLVFHPKISQQIQEPNFKAVIQTIKSLSGLYLYNKGPQSGRTAIEQQNTFMCLNFQSKKLRLIQQIQLFINKNQDTKNLNFSQNNPLKFPNFKFDHLVYIFQQNLSLQNLAVATYQGYNQMLNHFKQKKKSQSFNLIGTLDFLMMIPRTKAHTFQDINIDASAFFGLVRINTRDQYQKIRQKSPNEILGQVTYGQE